MQVEFWMEAGPESLRSEISIDSFVMNAVPRIGDEVGIPEKMDGNLRVLDVCWFFEDRWSAIVTLEWCKATYEKLLGVS